MIAAPTSGRAGAIDPNPISSNTGSTDAQPQQTLEKRLAQQAHWRLAPAVQAGEQSATDPDAYELEELDEGVRRYSVREQHRRTTDGRAVIVTDRLTKRLVDGRWTTVYETERVRSA